MEHALTLKHSALHHLLTLPLISIKNEVAQKKPSHLRSETALNSQAYQTLSLEHEVEKLQQDLDEERRRSLGFEQDLAHIIKQVIMSNNN